MLIIWGCQVQIVILTIADSNEWDKKKKKCLNNISAHA